MMTHAFQKIGFSRYILRRFVLASHILAGIVTLIAASVLVGWQTDNLTLKSVFPHMVAMNPTTAVAFIFSSSAVIVSSIYPHRKFFSKLAYIFASTVFLIGLIRLTDYLNFSNIGVDKIIFPDELVEDARAGLPNRMAPNTAFCFLLTGFALFFLKSRHRALSVISEGLALISGAIAVLAVVGYLYNTQELYRVADMIPMALHTAFSFTVLSAAILSSRPQRRAMAVLASPGIGGVMARRILPAVAGLLLVIGWISLLGVRKEVYGYEFGAAFFATVNIILLSVIIWRVSAFLNQAERARSNIERQQLLLATKSIECVTDGVIITDSDHRVIASNPAFSSLTGFSVDDLRDKDLRLFEEKQSTPKLEIRSPGSVEVWLRKKTGGLLPTLKTVGSVYNRADSSRHLISIFKDLSQFMRDRAELDFLANYDSLTLLANRKKFVEWTAHEIENAESSLRQVTLLVINIDQFHVINDSFGTSVGDLIIQTVAQRFSDCLTSYQQVASLGGDKFAIIVGQQDDTDATAQRLLACLAEPFDIAGREFHLHASIGISRYPIDGKGAEELLKNAEAAVRSAKEHGGNIYQYFSNELNATSINKLFLRHDLRLAVDSNEMFLLYQPRVDLKTGEVKGVEALIRWQHPRRGVVSPAEFIPHAEECGLIEPIGAWTLNTALSQLRDWIDSGVPPMRMAINLSAREFRQKDLVTRVANSLAENGIIPEYLEFEITESMAMDDPIKTKDILSELKTLGVEISIDDFGTGHSSLAFLKRFPIDHLKIDQSFVRGIPDDGIDVGITRSIIALARSLGLKTIAEGVETEEQRNFLKESDCDEMQGFLFSKPKRPDEIAMMFSKELHARRRKI